MKLMRALIVDPDQAARHQIAALLDESGFDSVEAGDGRAALRFASDYAIDLIIMEIDLGELDALQFLRIVRIGGFGKPQPPTIVSSVRLHGEPWITHPALEGLALLSRPFTPRAFATALDAAFPVE